MIVLLVLVVVAGAVGAFYVFRHRPEPNIESGIRSFRREMRALAPPPEGMEPPPAVDPPEQTFDDIELHRSDPDLTTDDADG